MSTLPAIAAELGAAILALPEPTPEQPPGTEGLSTVMNWIMWIGYMTALGALIVGGIMLAVSGRRGEGQDAVKRILFPIGGAIVIGAAVGVIGMFMS